MHGLISGIPICKDKVELTHLQFVDDTLLFVTHDTKKLLNYKRLVQCSSLMSSLDINFGKSYLVGWGTNPNWIK